MSIIVYKTTTNGNIQSLGRVPADLQGTASMNLVVSNPGASAAGPLVAYLSDNTSPASVDTIVPGEQIQSKGVMELACRLVKAGEYILVNGPAGLIVRVEIDLPD